MLLKNEGLTDSSNENKVSDGDRERRWRTWKTF